MNRYIVYTTEGNTSVPNPDVDVDNCQLLGFIESRSEKDAVKELFEKNDWIEKAGFSMDNTVALPLLTESL